MSAAGFAAEVDGEIDIRTAGPTETAAQANGLVALFNVMPQNNWPIHHIDAVWQSCVARCCTSHRVLIVPVVVERVKCH